MSRIVRVVVFSFEAVVRNYTKSNDIQLYTKFPHQINLYIISSNKSRV